MKRWSKLQKLLYNIIDENINFQIHCVAYRMKSQYGSTDLPRYYITLDKEIIFDYPADFINDEGFVKLVDVGMTKHYPYNTDISDISNLIKEYIDTPIDEIMSKHFENDHYGFINIIRASDRRIGARRFQELKKKISNKAAKKVIEARMKK